MARFTDEELGGFDLFNLLGKGCQLAIVHNKGKDKTFVNVKSVVGWPKGTPKPTITECPVLKYSEDEPYDLDKLPPWIQDKIKNQIDPNEPPKDETPPIEDNTVDITDPFDDPVPF